MESSAGGADCTFESMGISRTLLDTPRGASFSEVPQALCPLAQAAKDTGRGRWPKPALLASQGRLLRTCADRREQPFSQSLARTENLALVSPQFSLVLQLDTSSTAGCFVL